MTTPQKQKSATRERAAATPHARELTEDGEVVILRDSKLPYSITTGSTGKTIIVGAHGDIRVLEAGPQLGPAPSRKQFRENGDVIIHRTHVLTYDVSEETPTSSHTPSVSSLSGDRITVKPNGGITVGNK